MRLSGGHRERPHLPLLEHCALIYRSRSSKSELHPYASRRAITRKASGRIFTQSPCA